MPPDYSHLMAEAKTSPLFVNRETTLLQTPRPSIEGDFQRPIKEETDVITRPSRACEVIDLDEDTMATEGFAEVDPKEMAGQIHLEKCRLFAVKEKLFEKVMKSYSKIFDRQITATSGRDKGKNNNELRLAGVRLKISNIRTFRGLEALHERHGRESLELARTMLHKELDRAVEGKQLLPALAERKLYQKHIMNPKEAKVESIDADFEFCENLIADLKDLGRRA